MVAITTYFFARENDACPKRLYNAFWGGLFHDLPEAVTRDIISPVKTSSQELDDLIKNLESELAENEIYPLIEQEWVDEIKYFAIDEFSNKVIVNSEMRSGFTTTEVNENFNEDKFNPIDGQLIRAADRLAAFMEVWNSCLAGIKTTDMSTAAHKIMDDYSNRILGKLDLNRIYRTIPYQC
jgi:putative hydrolase of HD superfamily